MEVVIQAEQVTEILTVFVTLVLSIGCAVCAFQGFRAGNAFQ